MTTDRLFHIVLPEAWEAGSPQDLWAPPSLETEGFIHLSFAAQLQGTLDTHYGNVERVLLLEVSPTQLGAGLKLEVSRGDALFPHLYRSLRREEFIERWELVRDPEAGWRLPEL